jgi:hypothetical protein
MEALLLLEQFLGITEQQILEQGVAAMAMVVVDQNQVVLV